MINMSVVKIFTAVSDDDDEDDIGPCIRRSARGKKAWEEKRWFGAGEKLDQEVELQVLRSLGEKVETSTSMHEQAKSSELARQKFPFSNGSFDGVTSWKAARCEPCNGRRPTGCVSLLLCGWLVDQATR